MGESLLPEYTVAAVLGAVAVVVAELRWARTGVFRMPIYWASMGIVAFFMVLVDGWLTKLPKPIVIYDPREFSGVRFPFDIPVEDYFFGFTMITLTIVLWERSGRGRTLES